MIADLIDRWIRHIRDTKPKISIGDDPEAPTYWRYFVIPRNRVFNVYLHNWLNDDLHDPHDHRAANITIVLQGSYCEWQFVRRPTIGLPLPDMMQFVRRTHQVVFRRAATAHRVELLRNAEGKPIQCWSLFFKLPDTRDWGFWCKGRNGVRAFWRSHQDYAKSIDPLSSEYGQKGAGCG